MLPTPAHRSRSTQWSSKNWLALDSAKFIKMCHFLSKKWSKNHHFHFYNQININKRNINTFDSLFTLFRSQQWLIYNCALHSISLCLFIYSSWLHFRSLTLSRQFLKFADIMISRPMSPELHFSLVTACIKQVFALWLLGRKRRVMDESGCFIETVSPGVKLIIWKWTFPSRRFQVHTVVETRRQV